MAKATARLSILIPVYNEEETILKVLDEVNKVKIVNVEKEIIVVDDCSTDRTKHILMKAKNDARYKSVKIFYHSKNMGKGSAIRTAIKHSTGDIISIQDADLEYEPKNIINLIKPILEGKSDVVYGSRFLGKKLIFFGNKKTVLPSHWIGNRFLTSFTNLIYNGNITDMETGCKVFRKKIIKQINLKAKRFDIEPEITAKILKKGCKIKEIPIDFNPRTAKEGKKITWIDGIKAAYYLLKYRIFD